eukprot:7385306-Prymnesium_polylepis.1
MAASTVPTAAPGSGRGDRAGCAQGSGRKSCHAKPSWRRTSPDTQRPPSCRTGSCSRAASSASRRT